jgi:hypothetical protein
VWDIDAWNEWSDGAPSGNWLQEPRKPEPGAGAIELAAYQIDMQIRNERFIIVQSHWHSLAVPTSQRFDGTRRVVCCA